MRNPATEQPEINHFVYSPASSCPRPYARLIDRNGSTIHVWANDRAQPAVEDDPPSFLRGWNHVEVDPVGNLYAVVPLRALLKLGPDSSLLWEAGISAHHDMAISPSGELYVLTEAPRKIRSGDRTFVILDNSVSVLDAEGKLMRAISLYDVLITDTDIASLLHDNVQARYADFAHSGHRLTGAARELVASATYSGPLTGALQLLRQLPGSPCDAMHTNTVEILDAHPKGLWDQGHVLVSMRNLNLVAVVDLDVPRVLWSWGMGELSGQHQPSALPDGNVLIFDNGTTVGRSRVLEVDPAARTVVWEYMADPPGAFFSELAGGCERLPGGNILVTAAQAGRAFEVTQDKRVVWEWSTVKEPSSHPTSRVTLYRLAGVPELTATRLLAEGKVGR